MQRFPPDQPRKPERRTRAAQPRYETEQYREDDEHDATNDWLARIDAARIPRPEPVEGQVR